MVFPEVSTYFQRKVFPGAKKGRTSEKRRVLDTLRPAIVAVIKVRPKSRGYF